MERSFLRKGLAAAGATATLLAGLALVPSPAAEAAPPPGTKIIAATGSDTTEDLMEAYLANPDPNGPGDNGQYNVISRYDSGETEFVPGDALCGDRTYASNPLPPGALLAPNGSTAGRNALRDILADGDPTNDGCFEIARSSSSPRAVGPTGDRATFEYYAAALDGLIWASASLNAPASLTRAQVQGIYNCTYTDWSQVGGAPGPITRVLPQAGSGTRAFFEGDILGFNPVPITGPNCPAVVDTRDGGGPLNENAGSEIPVALYQSAILPYSAGQWIFQANLSINPTLDKRNGVHLGNLIPSASFTADTTNGSTTLSTAVSNRFTAVNVGASVTGTGIPAGTTVTAVSPDGTTATMSQAATATGSPSVTMTSLPATTARWITVAPGGWLPNTPNALNPRAPVSESQIVMNNPVRDFVGVRYVFNVIDSTSPNYVEARDLVGFDNIPGGTKSPLCSGTANSMILNAGFAPLSSTTPSAVDPSRNLAGSTCRRYTP